jgi:23S rRNA pseudouridine2605 synthase
MMTHKRGPPLFRKLPRLQHGKWQSVGSIGFEHRRVAALYQQWSIGQPTHASRFGLEREYAVRVLGALSREEKQQLLDGVQLDDGPAKSVP